MGSNTAVNHYALLGVASTATDEEIKRCYKILARKWHPDKNRDPAATEMFQNIVNAYEILGDVTTRHQYDVMQRIAGAQKDKPIKATTTTKHTSSTTNASSGYIPVDPLSDPALASLINTRGLMSYTMKQMKVMLAARRLPVSGSKAELIERLENYVNGVKKVKEPRVPRPPQQPQPQYHHRQYQQASGIPEGYFVRLHGLTTSYYNGKMAVVKSAVNENGRQLVELLGKLDTSLNQIYVKPGNMMVVRRVVVDSDSGDDDDWHGSFHHIRQPQQQQPQQQQQPSQQQPRQPQPTAPTTTTTSTSPTIPTTIPKTIFGSAIPTTISDTAPTTRAISMGIGIAI